MNQSQLINDLLNTMDVKIFALVLQLIVVGAVILWIKDFSSRVMNYYKLKMSDFGRGTRIEIDGHSGYIHYVGFNEVEIHLSENCTLLIPVERFIKTPKIIKTSNGEVENKPRRKRK